jgi:hypothetical protein
VTRSFNSEIKKIKIPTGAVGISQKYLPGAGWENFAVMMLGAKKSIEL